MRLGRLLNELGIEIFLGARHRGEFASQVGPSLGQRVLFAGHIDVAQRSFQRIRGRDMRVVRRGFKEIHEGKHDDVPETNFYMKGSIDMIKEG